MKLTAIILVSAALQVSASGHAQSITLTAKNVSLQKVFAEIEKQTQYNFVYTDDLLQNTKKVDVDIRNASIEQVLAICFRDQPLTYNIVEKVIVIKQKMTSPNETTEKENLPPPIDISGKITDEDGNPLEGATVTVKGTKQATKTDVNGMFKLRRVAEKATLEISYAEHITADVPVNDKTAIVISLKRAELSIQEVKISKGYYSEKQRYSVSNVGRVTAKDIEKQPVNNPLLALQGRVPGLFITQANGLPGGGVVVRIQGQNSIQNGNDPLYVIDGVPYISQFLPNLGSILGSSGGGISGNPLSNISPNDIEAIDILKDADATAIYGSRAANGAILITTKKGKAGKTKVSAAISKGWGEITKKLNLLSTTQYLEMRKEAYVNDGLPIPNASSMPDQSNYDLTVWSQNRYTDWQKKLIGGTSELSNIQLNISGGTSQLQYFTSIGYLKETTVFPGSFSDRKASFHFSLTNTSANQRFRFQLTSNYLYDNNLLPSRDLTRGAFSIAPNAPSLYDLNGNLNWEMLKIANDSVSTWQNPLASLFNKYQKKASNFIANSVLEYQILRGLNVRSSFGYSKLNGEEINTNPLVSASPEKRQFTERTSSFQNSSINTWIIEPQINYNKSFNHGKLDVLFGATFQESNSSSQRIDASGFASDLVLEDIKAAIVLSVPSDGSILSTYRYSALFGRINYVAMDRYILNATVRRDGSSRFGPENLFNNFFSIGGAWIFSEEKFFSKRLRFLTFGKLRANYGTTGSDQIGDYKFLNQYSFGADLVTVPYQGANGLTPNGLPNPYLQWEETKKFQIGVDLGFLKDKISVSANYVRNISSNQLLPYSLPIQTGVSSITKNFPATIENKALEFVLGANSIKLGKITWSTSLNFTLPKNTLKEFPSLSSSPYSNSLVVGQPITIVRLYKYHGVDPVSGQYQFLDSSGNPTLTPDYLRDRFILANNSPKFYGGILNQFVFKNFSLDIFFQFVKQVGSNYVMGDQPGLFFSGTTMQANQPVSVLNRWRKTGDVVSMQKYSSNYLYPLSQSYNDGYQSDLAWSDASFVRLKNLSFSWQLPEKLLTKIHIENFKIFLQAQNLLTATKYKDGDPESRGPALPPLKVITFGARVVL